MSTPPAGTAGLTGGRLLARNTAWNLAGQGAPLALALVAIPILVRGLGTDRFGVLALAWVVVGYFSLFDFGLGRALTQLVAQKLDRGGREELPALVWTALAAMAALGVAGAILVGLLSPWAVHRALKIPAAMQGETLAVFYLLAASLPLVIVSTGLAGVLEAHQRFDLSNAVRIPMGAFTFLGPVAALPVSRSLVLVVAALVGGRLVAAAAYLALTLRVMPVLRNSVRLVPAAVRPLAASGGWMTVSNVVGPLMTYLDRFLVGAVVSIAGVAYYATPYEVVTRLWVLPRGLAGVLFPAFATSYRSDPARTAVLFERGVKVLLVVLFPIALLIVGLAHDGLGLWLGGDFAARSTSVMQWLVAGVLLNSLAQIPFALVQGTGRPDITARLHLAEVAPYLAALWTLLILRGIEGAAIAWTARALIDMLLLFVLAFRRVPVSAGNIRRTASVIALSFLVLALAALPAHLATKAVFLAVAVAAFAFTAWFVLLSDDERALGRQRLRLARVLG